MSAWTPGPWEVRPGWLSGVMSDVTDADGCAIAWTNRHRPRAQEANARLIAASPDLYEALTEVIRVSSVSFDGKPNEIAEAYKAARAALSKVKG